MLAHYKAMLAFRKAHPALSTGTIRLLDAPDGVLAFVREAPEERLLCVFNMQDQPALFDLPEGMRPDHVGAPGTVDEPVAGALSLSPFGAYIGLLT